MRGVFENWPLDVGEGAGQWFTSSLCRALKAWVRSWPSPVGSGEPILAFPILQIITLASITEIEITNNVQGDGHFCGS